MAVIGIVIAVTAVASAEAAPSLPPRTAAQLLAEVAQASGQPLGPLTATIQRTANLGLPQLPAIAQPGGSTGLPTGTQSISIWYSDPQHIRLAEPVQDGESDLRLDGHTLWLWSSKTQTATRLALPAQVPQHLGPAVGPAGRGNVLPDSPLAAARQVLAAVGPSTAVSVQRNVYVAGRAAYQLSLVPRTSQSLIGSVVIAIDASRHIPLRLEIFARGSSGPAFSIGFTALSFGQPAASNFSFTPPPGATVKKETVPANLGALLGGGGLGPAGLNLSGLGNGTVRRAIAVGVPGGGGISSGSIGVLPVLPGRSGHSIPAIPKQALAAINKQYAKSLPASLTKAQRAKAIKAFDAQIMAAQAGAPNNGGSFVNTFSASAPHQPGSERVIGKDWLSVVATPPSPQVAAAVTQLLNRPGGPHQLQSSTSVFGSSSSQASSSALTVTPVPVGPDLAVLRGLMEAATPVRGSWGSGRLLRTTLLSVLVTSKGQILAGAVTPAVLYADVAADAG